VRKTEKLWRKGVRKKEGEQSGVDYEIEAAGATRSWEIGTATYAREVGKKKGAQMVHPRDQTSGGTGGGR